MARVSVVIPNWNGAGLLRRALQSVARQTHSAQEVIVVDNGSTDDSVTAAKGAGAHVIAMPQNRGFAHAVNAGIRTARAEWVAILNNDVELDAGWLGEIMSRAEAMNAWFGCGKLLAADEPGVLDGAWDAICRSACTWRCGSARPDGPAWNSERRVRFAPFTAVLARRELFQRVGMLDETFESYLEDTDFGIRCATQGYSGVYVPNAIARHRGSGTLGRWHKDTVRRISRNQLLLVAKHFPQNWVLSHGWHVLVGQALWGTLAFRHGAGISYLKGKIEGIRLFRRVRSARVPAPAVMSAILRESEAEVHELQKQTGYDLYWRLYFALT